MPTPAAVPGPSPPRPPPRLAPHPPGGPRRGSGEGEGWWVGREGRPTGPPERVPGVWTLARLRLRSRRTLDLQSRVGPLLSARGPLRTGRRFPGRVYLPVGPGPFSCSRGLGLDRAPIPPSLSLRFSLSVGLYQSLSLGLWVFRTLSVSVLSLSRLSPSLSVFVSTPLGPSLSPLLSFSESPGEGKSLGICNSVFPSKSRPPPLCPTGSHIPFGEGRSQSRVLGSLLPLSSYLLSDRPRGREAWGWVGQDPESGTPVGCQDETSLVVTVVSEG